MINNIKFLFVLTLVNKLLFVLFSFATFFISYSAQKTVNVWKDAEDVIGIILTNLLEHGCRFLELIVQ